MKEVISAGVGGELQQVLHVDNADQYTGAIELRQDVSRVLDMVRRAREQPVGKEFRKTAEIPMAVYLQACAEGWANDSAAWKRWLNNPDNAAFRVHGGRV